MLKRNINEMISRDEYKQQEPVFDKKYKVGKFEVLIDTKKFIAKIMYRNRGTQISSNSIKSLEKAMIEHFNMLKLQHNINVDDIMKKLHLELPAPKHTKTLKQQTKAEYYDSLKVGDVLSGGQPIVSRNRKTPNMLYYQIVKKLSKYKVRLSQLKSNKKNDFVKPNNYGDYEVENDTVKIDDMTYIS